MYDCFIGWLKTWDTHLPGSNWVTFQIFLLVCVVQYLNDQKKSKNCPLNLNLLQDDKKHFPKWPLLLISAGISHLFLMILEPSKSLQINIFFPGHMDPGKFKSIKKFGILVNLSQGGRGYMFELGQLSITSFWLYQNIEPSPYCLIFCQISNFLNNLGYSMSKWA